VIRLKDKFSAIQILLKLRDFPNNGETFFLDGRVPCLPWGVIYGWQMLRDVSKLRRLLGEEQLPPVSDVSVSKMNVLCKSAKRSIAGFTMCCFSFAKA